jgi:hypothetical protein
VQPDLSNQSSRLKDKLKARIAAAEVARKNPVKRSVQPAIITRGLVAAISPAGVRPLELKWRMPTSTLPPTKPALSQLVSQVRHFKSVHILITSPLFWVLNTTRCLVTMDIPTYNVLLTSFLLSVYL